MNRILEAFTKPHYQITAVDEIIQFVVAFVLVVVVGGGILFLWYNLTKE